MDLSSWKSKIERDEDVAGGASDDDDYDGVDKEDNNTKMAEEEKADLSFEVHDMYKDGVLTIGCVGMKKLREWQIRGLMSETRIVYICCLF